MCLNLASAAAPSAIYPSATMVRGPRRSSSALALAALAFVAALFCCSQPHVALAGRTHGDMVMGAAAVAGSSGIGIQDPTASLVGHTSGASDATVLLGPGGLGGVPGATPGRALLQQYMYVI